jgi:hypothetical protein
MSRRDRGAGADTDTTVKSRYRSWRSDNPAPASESALSFRDGLPLPELSPETGRVVFTAVGVGIGLLLLLLAVLAFRTAGWWDAVGRDGAQVGYFLVGCFLTVAGLGGIVSSYNHNYRVMTRPGGDH